MNRPEMIDKVTNDVVTIIAIIGIVYLGIEGVVDAEVIGAIAGLGGYRLYKNGKK
jgi:uncharacterized membrane protein YuzA (DUF378 family)